METTIYLYLSEVHNLISLLFFKETEYSHFITRGMLGYQGTVGGGNDDGQTTFNSLTLNDVDMECSEYTYVYNLIVFFFFFLKTCIDLLIHKSPSLSTALLTCGVQIGIMAVYMYNH